jgi:hypothetical protein
MRADEQKLHRRLSPGASWHLTTKSKGTRDRVNAAVVHREIMNLFGEICPAWQCRFLATYIARRVRWLNKAQACGEAADPRERRRQRTRQDGAARHVVMRGVTG